MKIPLLFQRLLDAGVESLDSLTDLGWERSRALSRALQLCIACLAIKVVGGIAVFAVGVRHDAVVGTPLPNTAYLLNILTFGAVGVWLIVANREDRRPAYLGFALLLIASSFSDPLVRQLPQVLPPSHGPLVRPLSSIQPDAFLPFCLWLFFYHFPRVDSCAVAEPIFRAAIPLSLLIGLALFLINIAGGFWPLFSDGLDVPRLLALWERKSLTNYYWTAIFCVSIPTLPLASIRARSASASESQRVRVFLTGLGIGSLPIMIEVVLEELIPAFKARMSNPTVRYWVGLLFYALVLSIPVTTAYSILVNRVLNVRLMVRQALRHSLARHSALVVIALPFIGLVWYLYRHRDERVSELVTGPGLIALAIAVLAAASTTRLRHRLLNAIDRRYFRDQYDSRAILTSLVEKSRATASVDELAGLLLPEIDRALHLESVAILTLRPALGVFSPHSSVVRPLSSSSALAALVEENLDPLEVDMENPRSPLHRLPLEDREWLADSASRLVVPLVASDGQLIGLIALGGKKSQLHFSREDRGLLRAISASVAVTLESRFFSHNQTVRNIAGDDALATTGTLRDELASECGHCSTLQTPRTLVCTSCGGKLENAQVPYILLGKFRLEKRIGSGGMGVVYRAFDIALGRTVAIKTLPKVSPEHSMRLRREARAVAAVVHPNLALIFGAETWRGTPMLIFEYLGGGTLADRLRDTRFTPRETVELGIVLASVLQKTHALGILHRDIKPSNIGYTTDNQPKLLDFGLAHVLHDSRRAGRVFSRKAEDYSNLETVSLTLNHPRSMTLSNHIVGTPAYLSPECVQLRAADPSFDLWAVAMVLYQCLSGRNPMERHTMKETFDCIARADVPDILTMARDCPPALVSFFRDALAKDRRRRPRTAGDLLGTLQSLTPNDLR